MIGVDSRVAFTALVALVVVERLVELVVSRSNERRLLAAGGVELGDRHYPWMVAVHTALLVGAPLEVWLLGRPFVGWLAALCVAALVATMAVRYWVVATLGGRWTTRLVVLPGAPLVEAGPYRWMRHPNYAAVVVEVAALPLVHTAWATAVAASLANAAVLAARIRAEDAALHGAAVAARRTTTPDG